LKEEKEQEKEQEKELRAEEAALAGKSQAAG